MRPTWAKANTTWWWTHERLRNSYRLLSALVKRKHLFTFLEPEFVGLGISSTTNRIEGGINSPIKDLLKRHRGMPSDHQRRAIDWFCYLHSTNPKPPISFIREENYQPKETLIKPVETPDEIPGDWGTRINLEDGGEGIWIQKGWAGRSH